MDFIACQCLGSTTLLAFWTEVLVAAVGLWQGEGGSDLMGMKDGRSYLPIDWARGCGRKHVVAWLENQ